MRVIHRRLTSSCPRHCASWARRDVDNDDSTILETLIEENCVPKQRRVFLSKDAKTSPLSTSEPVHVLIAPEGPPEPVKRLTRDIAKAAASLTDTEARYLVDAYYMMQDDRKRASSQVRALGDDAEPNSVLQWLADQSTTLEAQIKRALDQYTQAHLMGSWMRDVYGIGPVRSAGLLAHIDITKAPTVGHIWRFAGLDPTLIWEKKMKRPWNAQLKVLCWKIGDSFVKFSGQEECIYGHVYLQRKTYEIERNESMGNKEVALERAAKVGKTTEAYKSYSIGKLPPAHIDMRARRYAVKLFLSHMHEVWYTKHFNCPPPLPYPLAHLGHAHKIEPRP